MSTVIQKSKLFALRGIAFAMASRREHPAPGRMDRERLAGGRIAVVKVDRIGDFVLATTFLRLLKDRFPSAKVTLFCRKPVGDLARQQFPQWTVVELPGHQSTLHDVLFDGKTRRLLKSQAPFDCLIDLRTFRDFSDTAVSSWIPAAAKIALENSQPEAGTRMPGEQRIYDELIPLPDYTKADTAHDILNLRRLANFVFGDSPDAQIALPQLQVSKEEQDKIIQRLGAPADGRFLLACPGAGSAIREYPVAALAEAIITASKQIHLPVIITGSPAEVQTNGNLMQRLKQGGVAASDITGTLSLREHVALVSLATAVVCMETSNAHIAAALNRPTVAIIGGGHYNLFAPWGRPERVRWLTNPLPCFGCHWQCIHEKPFCIVDVKPAAIAGAIAEIIP